MRNYHLICLNLVAVLVLCVQFVRPSWNCAVPSRPRTWWQRPMWFWPNHFGMRPTWSHCRGFGRNQVNWLVVFGMLAPAVALDAFLSDSNRSLVTATFSTSFDFDAHSSHRQYCHCNCHGSMHCCRSIDSLSNYYCSNWLFYLTHLTNYWNCWNG